MSPPRRTSRLLRLLLVTAVVGAPAAVLGAFCVGGTCEPSNPASAPVPFCSLPADLRDRIADGFRDGRSPHILAVTGPIEVVGGTGIESPSWPSITPDDAGRVPLVFHGTRVNAGAPFPPGGGLDDVAPTIAELIGLDRPHPEVRSGEALQAVVSEGPSPRLVLEVVWKGLGSRDLELRPDMWPTLRSLLRGGAGSYGVEVGSLPLDPAAVLTTIGTGGLPRDHGITGTLVRNDRGALVRAWGKDAPFSVIAGLGDDLDQRSGEEARIGLVGTDPSDRGIIGGNWYVTHDRDDVLILQGADRQVAAAERLLRTGYGADQVPDLLAVVLDAPIPRLDRALGSLLRSAGRAAGDSVTVVVTSTGSSGSPRPAALSGSWLEHEVERRVGPVVEAAGIGGLFVDQAALADQMLSEDRVTGALRRVPGPSGEPLLADVFPAIAVTFARYC